ncbi:uncharacterized protein LOC134824251 [Bolinopsis microptera]|uniref:uncharacterized protein LOC134824251 n=1 Tax=Bolinopsis microptera TaxID=2820187 RepID=UPI0030790087
MDKYLENGKQIYEEYCSTAENLPTMLPRAPEQTYIDVYPDEDQPGPSFRDDKRHQLDYETEVKVYRALEEVDGNFIVLHSFKYTHDQYCLCDKSHVRDKKKCNKCKNQYDKEGECDFIIICPDSFIVIEVKNMEHVDREIVECEPDFHLCSIGEDWQPECTTRKLEALIGTYKKSAEQRDKIVELIKCIDKDANIHQFTAYPNFSKRFKEQFQFSEITELRLSDDELSTIIFEEDLCRNELDAAWWAANVTLANSSSSDSHERVRNILLAIWATERNTCDKSKCSLGRCIMDVNKQLKEGRITFEPKKGKKRNQNPAVVKAPDIIRNNSNVENLTVEQHNAFESKENLLLINGPAGAGKTVILCGKILQLLESDKNNKVVVFKFTGEGNNSQHYQSALDNASIKYELISTSEYDHTPEQLANLITECLCSVIIVEISGYEDTTYLTDRLSVLSGYNLFVDDIQTVIDYNTTAEEWALLINTLKNLSADKIVWIACDIVQAWTVYDIDQISRVANVLTDILAPHQRTTLSSNLRNTFDLSNILSVIRDQFVKLCSLKSDILDIILPSQSPGHFIHGTLPVIHVFNNRNVDSIVSVINIDLDRLCATHELNYSDIGIVYTDSLVVM